MKNFKTIVNENHLASMPKALLHAKTKSALADHGYDENKEAGYHMSREAGEPRHVMHHRVDNDHADHLNNNDDDPWAGDDYITDGPEHRAVHQKLEDLGWRHLPQHGMHHVLGDAKIIKTDVYEHPNGASMTHMAHHDEDRSDHYWHLR